MRFVFVLKLVVLSIFLTGFLICSAQGSIDGESSKHTSHAIQNYGVRGAAFKIAEKSLLEVIQEKLLAAEKSGKLLELQEKFKEKAIKKITSPAPVSGIVKTLAPREFFFEPSYMQVEDVKDHLGNIIIKAGTTVNSLEHFILA